MHKYAGGTTAVLILSVGLRLVSTVHMVLLPGARERHAKIQIPFVRDIISRPCTP
jgi:hypothetical protein